MRMCWHYTDDEWGCGMQDLEWFRYELDIHEQHDPAPKDFGPTGTFAFIAVVLNNPELW